MSTKLQIPVSSIVEEFKVAKPRLLLTLRDSDDNKISAAGRKWSVSHAVEQAKSSPRHRDIMGAANIGREGLGTRRHQRWEAFPRQEKTALVQTKIR